MTIRLHIERLVLDAHWLQGARGESIKDELEKELANVLAEKSVHQNLLRAGLRDPRTRAAVRTRALPAASPVVQIARALGSGLASPPTLRRQAKQP